MAALSFVTSNPFTEHYRAGVAAADAEAARDQALQTQKQQYDITSEQRPFKLRDVMAATDTADSIHNTLLCLSGFFAHSG